jgi:hypothetical protein
MSEYPGFENLVSSFQNKFLTACFNMSTQVLPRVFRISTHVLKTLSQVFKISTHVLKTCLKSHIWLLWELKMFITFRWPHFVAPLSFHNLEVNAEFAISFRRILAVLLRHIRRFGQVPYVFCSCMLMCISGWTYESKINPFRARPVLFYSENQVTKITMNIFSKKSFNWEN